MKTKLVLLLLSVPWMLGAENIKPLTIDKAVTAGGTSARKYIVVHTTIQKNPNKEDSRPIVDRAVIGEVPTAIGKMLKVPDKLTDLQAEAGVNITQMTGMISQTIGAVGAQMPDPRAKAAAAATSLAVGTLGVLTDQGMKIAGKIMDKFYGKTSSLISMIEIFPKGYYEIDTATGKVSVTTSFENDLSTLRELQAQYQPVLQAFHDAYLNYTKEYNKAVIALDDATEQEEAAIVAKLAASKNSLTSLAEAKVKIEAKLANLQLYRVALMRYNLPQLGTCGGSGSGPAILRLFVFLGANQTNVYDIPYCAPNPNTGLHANIQFVLPGFDSKGAYFDGGIQLVCPDRTINFQGLTASQDLTFGYASSKVYNFYDTLLTSEAAGYEQFLVPFNVFALQAELEAEIKAAAAKNDVTAKEELTSLMDSFKTSMEKAQAEGFTGFGKAAASALTKPEEVKVPILEEPSEASTDTTSLEETTGTPSGGEEPGQEPTPTSSTESHVIIEEDEDLAIPI